MTPLSGPHGAPRLVIAAPGSGHGKTTVASGIMGALRHEGLEVAGFKIGPDYIDPGYHALATGRPGRNLDPHLCAPDQLTSLLLHGILRPRPADVAIVEGVMGLYDGRMESDGFASTAHVAQLIDAPVIIVLDISAMGRTAAAIVHGLRSFDPGVRVAGVIINKAGTPRHAREVQAALEDTGTPVLGVLPRDAGVEAPSRHLGLVPAAERDDAAAGLARLAAQTAEFVDLAGLLAVAHSAPALDAAPWDPYAVVSPPSDRRPVVAVAGGRAFTFRYAETTELLRAAGCEPVVFDPTTDPALPDGAAGLYLGGGFPEVHAGLLGDNAALREDVRAAVAAGLPTLAECAGLLYLCTAVDGQPMVGAVPATGTMTRRLTLGYRHAVADTETLLGPAGTRVSGHEFHRTTVTPGGTTPAWLGDGVAPGFALDPAGTGRATLHASYLHVHWAGHPRLAQAFADAVHAYAPGPRPRPAPTRPRTTTHDLDHHGDADVGDGLVDLAVNVRVPAPPAWLAAVVDATTPELAAYPRTDATVAAIAAAHGVEPARCLPTAGGAEAFTLLARARPWRRPVVVHPQFTEPEAALRAAGAEPRRVLLRAEDGFVLDPAAVPDDADLVVVGNPTNPTGVLHRAETLAALARPGRVLCVDEAFMDAVPGEPETLIGRGLPGVVVLRSLTKTWGLAGLRAGYVVGDADVVADLRAQQPPWSVSTPALAVTVACLAADGRRRAADAAAEIAERRTHLVAALAEVGLRPAAPSAGPFVLLDTHGWGPPGAPGWVRHALREQGFAVRRGESFPGLDADWIRIAVRDEDTTGALVKALTVLRDGR